MGYAASEPPYSSEFVHLLIKFHINRTYFVFVFIFIIIYIHSTVKYRTCATRENKASGDFVFPDKKENKYKINPFYWILAQLYVYMCTCIE